MVSCLSTAALPILHKEATIALATVGFQQIEHIHKRNLIPEQIPAKPTGQLLPVPKNEYLLCGNLIL